MQLSVWGVPGRHVPGLVARSRARQAALRRRPGLRFVKLLGTGSGRSFALRDADPRHWALLTVWESAAAAAAARDPVAEGWDSCAGERLRVTMRPIWSTGRWAGVRPFADAAGGDPTTAPDDALGVAALTRARLRPRTALTFRRAVPDVAADLAGRDGLRLAMGVGETPVLHQGTFSLWRSTGALTAFARGAAHRDVVRRTPVVGWYAEEAFARFAVLGVEGTYRGAAP